MTTRWWSALLAGLFVASAGLRALDVWRPVDGTVRDSWREPDVAGIARNFHREGMNIFYPRIDWRGDGPGYVESEFPLPAWLGAASYRVFGYHEEALRVISYLFALGATSLFFRLAWTSLPPVCAVAASAVWTVSPIGVRMASAIQPEPLMSFGLLAAVLFFREWCRTQKRTAYWLAVFATTLAILAKMPAAHVGLLFVLLAWQTFGWSAAKRLDLWGFTVIALGVSLAWYAHAHSLWNAYGNSLGISNEAYGRITSLNFAQAALQTMPGVFRLEADLVWTWGGIALGAIGFAFLASHREQRWIAGWLGVLGLYYFVTGRTTGEGWAWHYHISSLPAACLAMGAGTWPLSKLVAARFPGWLPQTPTDSSEGAHGTTNNVGDRPAPGVASWGFAACVGLLLVATLLLETRRVRWDLHPHEYMDHYECALRFREHLNAEALIVASGPGGVDQYGLKRASNPPYMFFWTETKGFNLGDDEQNLVALEGLRSRGARYFIAEKRSLKEAKGFEAELRTHHRILDEHDVALLVELVPPSESQSLANESSDAGIEPGTSGE